MGEKAARPVRAGRAVAFGRNEIGAGESSVAGWAESNPRLLGFDDVVMAVCAGIEIDFFRGAAPIACHGVCERVVFDDLDFIDEDLYLLMEVQVPVKMRILHARSNRAPEWKGLSAYRPCTETLLGMRPLFWSR